MRSRSISELMLHSRTELTKPLSFAYLELVCIYPLGEALMNRLFTALLLIALSTAAPAQIQSLELQRNGQTITIEPYTTNGVRVTLSIIANQTEAGPAYGSSPRPE